MSLLKLALYFLLFLPGACFALPRYEEVKNNYASSEAALLDRHGEVIQEKRVDSTRRRLSWTPLSAISPTLQKAVVAAEDKRFFEHRGVDWKAMAGVGLRLLKLSRPRGASTLTMQLAGILRGGKFKKGRRSVSAKWNQMNAAWEIERSWTKDQILEAYLNLVTYRGELEGVASAARGFYGKRPHGLSTEESIILAALIRDPNAKTKEVSRRACDLSVALSEPVECKTLIDLIETLFSRSFVGKTLPSQALAPHAARLLLARGKNLAGNYAEVKSTIDGGLQRFSIAALRNNLLEVRERNVEDGAILVANNRTGEILAYVGSSAELTTRAEVDGVRAPRQAGSSLKPFLYATALDQKILTPASLLDDSPLEIPVFGGVYRPRNYDNQFHGPVTVRTALASSLNIPAVRALVLIGIPEMVERMQALGFADLREPEYYGPSLALGSADVTLWELVNGYRALANKGKYSELTLGFQGPMPAPRRVFSEQATFLISQILSDRAARYTTFGMESPLSTRFWSAVKTGTSKDMRDNWCIGYSEEYTVGVWVGNFSGAPMWNVTGITGAAPIWFEVMNYLHRNKMSQPPKVPAGMAQQKVNDQNEWFIKNTEPGNKVVLASEETGFAHIVYPTEGEQMAFDPDIPLGNQKIYPEASLLNQKWSWRLNGNSVGGVTEAIAWEPKKGLHLLELIDDTDHVLDTVHFMVKGG